MPVIDLACLEALRKKSVLGGAALPRCVKGFVFGYGFSYCRNESTFSAASRVAPTDEQELRGSAVGPTASLRR